MFMFRRSLQAGICHTEPLTLRFHVFNFHIVQVTELYKVFQHFARTIGMHMHFCNVACAYYQNAVTQCFQICTGSLYIHLSAFRAAYNHFGTVLEGNLIRMNVEFRKFVFYNVFLFILGCKINLTVQPGQHPFYNR